MTRKPSPSHRSSRPPSASPTHSGDARAAETSSERQGMGRGHRRNFDESDDDATTRGQSTADATSDARDSGVRRRSRAMDEPTPRTRSSSTGGRSAGHRSDW